MIIGGVKIFLPSVRGEAITSVADVAEGQQAKTVMEEKEQMMMYVPTEGENPVQLLTQWELELRALEDWLDNPELEGGFQKIAMPKEIHRHEFQLVEYGTELAEEPREVRAKQKTSDERPAGGKIAIEWKDQATKGEGVLGS
jgi:hypothetical protein